MIETLRDQQRRLARLRILEAAATEIAAHGPSAVSMTEVAKRAGVSLRTVYNYFPDKEAVVSEIAEEAQDRFARFGGVDPQPDLDVLASVIRTNWHVLDALGDLGLAMARIDAERMPRSRRRRAGPTELTATLREALVVARPDLDPDQVDAITATLRALVDVRSRRRTGERLRASGDVVAWAFETLRDALVEGRGPYDDG